MPALRPALTRVRRHPPTTRLVLALAVLACAGTATAQNSTDTLLAEHRTWLDEEVVYIITEREREFFLTLESLEERNLFIEAFWRKRDPNRATPANEFRDEHYRRLAYANENFGRETFRDGWRTDRGRYYIILGEPQEINRYDGYSELVSTHLWFYAGGPQQGTPSFFYLMFFKRNDLGEYRLYHPATDGPLSLLRPNNRANGDDTAAINTLLEISPDLAHASLSYDTSEPPDYQGGAAAIGTELMLARIEESPKRSIRTDYTDAWSRYGRRVSAEYSFNFVPSRSVFSTLVDRSGTAIVQYSIEIDPENFSLETDEAQTKYYASLELTFEARSNDGTLVVANDREAFVELSPSQALDVRSRPFAYQDDFPLVPGDYTLSVIVRNRVDAHYTVAEADVSVPELSGAPVLSDVILAYDVKTIAQGGDAGEIYTYQTGRTRFSPAAGGIFVIGDTVHCVSQAYGASADHRVDFDLILDGETLRSVSSDVGAHGMAQARMELDELGGGVYGVRARLVSPAAETLSEKVMPLTISPRSVAERPGFVYRRGIRTDVPGLLSFIRGEQYWNKGRFDDARLNLEDAVASGNERLVPARWMLANAYLRENEPDKAFALLQPLEASFPRVHEVIAGLGFVAHLKGEYERAVDYLERARGIRPPGTALLNALGDSHTRLGNVDAAREAYERSLELDADQPETRDRLTSLGTPPVRN